MSVNRITQGETKNSTPSTACAPSEYTSQGVLRVLSEAATVSRPSTTIVQVAAVVVGVQIGASTA
jgi:hypothetical protein